MPTTEEVVIGFVQLVFSAIGYGCMFVPLKRFNAGDGMFSQWVMSIAIVLFGFCGFAWRGFSDFYPVAMLGGFVWTFGNALAIPVINRIGMGLGFMIWSATNCLTGWLLGTFGAFGIKPRPASNLWLTGFGLISVLTGGILFCFVKNKKQVEEKPSETSLEEADSVAKNGELVKLTNGADVEMDTTAVRVSNPTPSKADRIIGIVLALLAGAFYGCKIFPVVYIQDNKELYPDAPQDGLSYIFSHFFGVFITSTTVFLIYAIAKKNRPVLPSHVALPAFASGLIWATATALLLNATTVISAAITYPIATTVPGVISGLWGVFVFKEVGGKRNLILMGAATVITIIGAICIGASK